MHELLPDYLKVSKIVSNTKGKLDFDNLCSIISAGSNTDYARGRTVTNIYIDESDWIKNLYDIITCLYPCLSVVQNTKLFSFSSLRIAEIFKNMNPQIKNE